MTAHSMLRYPSAVLPLAMSLAALATVLVSLAVHGPAPQVDEGAAAHVWQLLMAAQIPLILYFAMRWVPQAPRHGGWILALQFAAAIAAMVPVYLLRW